MKKDSREELESKIISKMKNKKNPNNIDEFLLLVHSAKKEASKDVLKAYKILMSDLVKIEELKKEQKELADGLKIKYGKNLAEIDGILNELTKLRSIADEELELERQIEEESKAASHM